MDDRQTVVTVIPAAFRGLALTCQSGAGEESECVSLGHTSRGNKSIGENLSGYEIREEQDAVQDEYTRRLRLECHVDRCC